MSDPTSRRLTLPVHGLTTFVLVRTHYPENVGASARAMKTMGFSELALVKPGRLAVPGHEMAFKMAVRAWDVLHAAKLVSTVGEAVEGSSLVFATTSHRGVSGVYTAREVAKLAKVRGVDMPVSEAVNAVLEGRLGPQAAVEQLLSRDPKREG